MPRSLRFGNRGKPKWRLDYEAPLPLPASFISIRNAYFKNRLHLLDRSRIYMVPLDQVRKIVRPSQITGRATRVPSFYRKLSREEKKAYLRASLLKYGWQPTNPLKIGILKKRVGVLDGNNRLRTALSIPNFPPIPCMFCYR